MELQDAVDGALEVLAEHAVLSRVETLLQSRRRIQPVAFQFWGSAVSRRRLHAAGLQTWRLRHFGRVHSLWNFLRQSSAQVLGRPVGCAHSSAAIGQLPAVVSFESQVAGRVVNDLAGAGLLLDGESESPPGAGAVRLQSWGALRQSGPRCGRGGAARGGWLGGARGMVSMRGRC